MDPSITVSLVLPCFNESDSLNDFLNELVSVLSLEVDHRFNIIMVDDCSTDNSPELLKNYQTLADNVNYYVIRNSFNVGHQKSIFHGLLFTADLKQDYVIIMDSDGEDDPKVIPDLLKSPGHDIVEVKRGKRKNSLLFKMLHGFYKLLFRILIGKQLDYGNFCMLSNSVVERIRSTSFIHLPAYLLKLNVPRSYITAHRNRRISGRSKMNYEGLMMHGFKSLVEFGDILLKWLLRIFVLVAVLLLAITSNLFYQKFVTHTAIPGWFSTLFIGMLNLAMVCLGFFVVGILLVNRKSNGDHNTEGLYRIIKMKS